MLINIKYLVITVISIFLAMSIGIFMGAQLDSQSIVVKQQETLISKIEQQFDELSKTNAAMEDEIKSLMDKNTLNEAYINNIFPDYIEGKLSGAVIAVIKTTEDYDFGSVEQVLEMAGARIPAVITVTDRLMEAGGDELNNLMNYFGAAKNQDAGNLIAQKIIEALTHGKTQDLEYLQQAGYIEASGNFDGAPGYAVICGGSKEKTAKCEALDIPLIKSLKGLGLTVVGVETVEAANSYMEIYKKQKISTVDNADTVIGQTSLVLVLSGKAGNFGVKSTAKSLMPKMGSEGEK
ncbi:MAG: copper transporter [Tepidanaerobacteraceae bacterium]|jgi:cell division protein FtsB|nr:copper transporter [Tepidanaerobacteraceae bacterium]